MVVTGCLLAPICICSISTFDFWRNSSPFSLTVLAIIVTLIGFLGGTLLFVILRIAIMIHRIGNIEAIKVSVYQHPLSSIKAVGSLLFRISIIALFVYFFGISMLFTGIKQHGGMVFIIIAFFGAVVVLFFILPQVKIHQIMFKVKHQRLRDFSVHLESALEQVTMDPSQINIQRVRELFEIQKSLNGMGEWPFDLQLLLLLITGIAIPIAVVVIQIILAKTL